jgi:hypothetical protein
VRSVARAAADGPLPRQREGIVDSYGKVVDVVERERGEGRVERPFVPERLKGRPAKDRALRCTRIDRQEP